jgi:hypothetical protein
VLTKKREQLSNSASINGTGYLVGAAFAEGLAVVDETVWVEYYVIAGSPERVGARIFYAGNNTTVPDITTYFLGVSLNMRPDGKPNSFWENSSTYCSFTNWYSLTLTWASHSETWTPKCHIAPEFAADIILAATSPVAVNEDCNAVSSELDEKQQELDRLNAYRQEFVNERSAARMQEDRNEKDRETVKELQEESDQIQYEEIPQTLNRLENEIMRVCNADQLTTPAVCERNAQNFPSPFPGPPDRLSPRIGGMEWILQGIDWLDRAWDIWDGRREVQKVVIPGTQSI